MSTHLVVISSTISIITNSCINSSDSSNTTSALTVILVGINIKFPTTIIVVSSGTRINIITTNIIIATAILTF